MEKEQFVARIANRLNTAPGIVEAAVDATLAELFTPTIFAPPGQRRAAFDNNCNNNCAAEIATRAPSRA